MSEELLKAIIQLFAIVAKERITEDERTKIKEFLALHLNQEAIKYYLNLFDQFCQENNRLDQWFLRANNFRSKTLNLPVLSDLFPPLTIASGCAPARTIVVLGSAVRLPAPSFGVPLPSFRAIESPIGSLPPTLARRPAPARTILEAKDSDGLPVRLPIARDLSVQEIVR